MNGPRHGSYFSMFPLLTKTHNTDRFDNTYYSGKGRNIHENIICAGNKLDRGVVVRDEEGTRE